MDDNDIPDWKLVERVGVGDDEAFDTLMERHKRPVLAFVYRMIGDSMEAQDVAQVVFARAYRAMRRRGVTAAGAQFSTWLFQIARNAALDTLRHRQRRPTESLAAAEAEGRSLPGREPTPDAQAVATETGEQVAAAVAQLPEEQRAAIVLSEYEGLSDARIAAILKCSVKSVEARLYRARRFLRARLAHLIE